MEGNSKIINDKYYLTSNLYSTNTADIYVGHSKYSSQSKFQTQVTIKVLKEQHQSEQMQYTQELALLSKLNHKNIIKVIEGGHGSIVSKGKCSDKKYYLIIEHAAKQQLFNYICYPKKPFEEDKARYIFAEILDGVQACHLAGIVHRNLKTENIMLDAEWNIKIGDFDYAVFIDSIQLEYKPISKLDPPELRRKKQYDLIKADIFSLGIILFILVVGNPPFNETNNRDILYRSIIKNDYDSYWQKIDKSYNSTSMSQSQSKEFMDLVTKMLSNDPINRPSIEEIKVHPWMCLPYSSEEDIRNDLDKREDIILDKQYFEQREDNDNEKNSSKVYRSVNSNSSTNYFKSNCKCKKRKKKENFASFNFKGINPIRLMNDLAKVYDAPEESFVEIDNKRLMFTITFEQLNVEMINGNECDCDYEYEYDYINGELESQQVLKIRLTMNQICENNEYQLILKKKTGNYSDFIRKWTDMNRVIEKIMKIK